MLRQVGALLREKRYSAGYGDRLGGVRMTPSCQHPSGPRPWGGKGEDKSSSQSDFKGGLCKTPCLCTLFGPTKDRGGFWRLHFGISSFAWGSFSESLGTPRSLWDPFLEAFILFLKAVLGDSYPFLRPFLRGSYPFLRPFSRVSYPGLRLF